MDEDNKGQEVQGGEAGAWSVLEEELQSGQADVTLTRTKVPSVQSPAPTAAYGRENTPAPA